MKAIKEKIRQHLAKVTEATAKKIGVAIGMKDYPSDVVKALSEMRTDAELECEKRKGQGNELWYWLTNVTAAACVQESGESETQAALTGPSEIQSPPVRKSRKTESEPVLTQPAHDDEVAHLREQLADAEQVIANARKALAVKEGESLVLAIEKTAADLTYKAGVIDDYQNKLGHARLQVEALNEQLMHGEEAIDVKDAACGYLVCAPKRKPAKLMKPESAVAKAKAMAKATGRCEVFALVPVGIATRKQVKSVEFKEAKAA
jgi:hypothetical protein